MSLLIDRYRLDYPACPECGAENEKPSNGEMMNIFFTENAWKCVDCEHYWKDVTKEHRDDIPDCPECGSFRVVDGHIWICSSCGYEWADEKALKKAKGSIEEYEKDKTRLGVLKKFKEKRDMRHRENKKAFEELEEMSFAELKAQAEDNFREVLKQNSPEVKYFCPDCGRELLENEELSIQVSCAKCGWSGVEKELETEEIWAKD